MDSDTSAPALLCVGWPEVRPADWSLVLDHVEVGSWLVVETLPTKALARDDAETEWLNARLAATGRPRTIGSALCQHTLAETGGSWYLHEDRSDVWSTLWMYRDGYRASVANVGDVSLRASVEISTAVRRDLVGGEALDMATGETWTVGTSWLWPAPLVLEPKRRGEDVLAAQHPVVKCARS
jgi:hypothetical protein